MRIINCAWPLLCARPLDAMCRARRQRAAAVTRRLQEDSELLIDMSHDLEVPPIQYVEKYVNKFIVVEVSKALVVNGSDGALDQGDDASAAAEHGLLEANGLTNHSLLPGPGSSASDLLCGRRDLVGSTASPPLEGDTPRPRPSDAPALGDPCCTSQPPSTSSGPSISPNATNRATQPPPTSNGSSTSPSATSLPFPRPRAGLVQFWCLRLTAKASRIRL